MGGRESLIIKALREEAEVPPLHIGWDEGSLEFFPTSELSSGTWLFSLGVFQLSVVIDWGRQAEVALRLYRNTKLEIGCMYVHGLVHTPKHLPTSNQHLYEQRLTPRLTIDQQSRSQQRPNNGTNNKQANGL